MKPIFDECWCRLEHGECVHFKVDADRNESTCKRLDHKHIKFWKPYFKSYDCGQFMGNVCRDFEPRKESVPWLYNHWQGWDDYWDGEEPKPNETIPLVLDGNFSVMYHVLKTDFINNTFLNDDGSLKWIKRQYYKRSRKSPIGYELVTETNEI